MARASIADMATEIERKFLVAGDDWRALVRESRHMIQGYLANTERGSIRVRVSGARASLNIKSMTLGVTRTEFDYAIPPADARTIQDTLCMRPLIEKTRHYVTDAGHDWEIDEFEGENAGLVVAELELNKDDENFARPAWLGREVSDDPRYYNVCLVERPYCRW
jgi:adenylate cyclase